MLDYYCRLLKSFPSLTWDYVQFELPTTLGWQMHGWAVENDGWLQFSGVKRKGDGPIRQEVKRLMAMVHNGNG